MIRVKGFFLLTVPAITNWIVMQIRCMMITTRNTFQRMLKMAKVFPEIVISVKVPQMISGSSGMIIV